MELEPKEERQDDTTFHHSFNVPYSDWKIFSKKLIDWRGNYQMAYALRLLIYGVNEDIIDMKKLEEKLRVIEEKRIEKEDAVQDVQPTKS